MTCPNCGAQIPAVARFCPKCGFALAQPTPVADDTVDWNPPQDDWTEPAAETMVSTPPPPPAPEDTTPQPQFQTGIFRDEPAPPPPPAQASMWAPPGAGQSSLPTTQLQTTWPQGSPPPPPPAASYGQPAGSQSEAYNAGYAAGGYATGPQPYAPGPYQPAQQERKKSRLPLVIAIIAVFAVLGGGGAFAAITFMNSQQASPTVTDEPVSEPPPDVSTAPTEPTSAAPEPEPEPPTTYLCWNDKVVESLSDCADLTAKPGKDKKLSAPSAGLSYIYPSLVTQLEEGRCAWIGYRATTETWECTFDGGDGLIRYRYWDDTAAADKHYDEKFSSDVRAVYDFSIGATEVGTAWENNSKNDDKRYELTLLWGDSHYSLTVEATNRGDLVSYLDKVRFRAPDQLVGYPDVAGNPAEGQAQLAER
ncbi:MAG: zinc-ribbon domain-containing protein [Propionibacteriaceae bacterium]|jgi:hypothetical protein|nr:zinc-ribbon domain-containing protein [Propionibacteriaceae bacterium]